MADGSEGDGTVRLVLRWWVIVLVAVLGIAFVVAPFLYEPFGSWEVITSATLTNVGTTMTFAAVLFLLERAFVRRVAGQARAQATKVVADATADLREENQQLAARLSDLSGLLAASDIRREKVREQAVGAFEDDVSFDTLTRLMETANDLNALTHGRIVVPAGVGLDAPRITFFWGRRFYSSSNVFDDAALELLLRNESSRIVRLNWTAAMDVREAALELDRICRAAGLIAEADAIDFQVLLTHLRNAVDAAIAGRSSGDSWPSGRISEWITDDWAITDQGVEVKGRGVVIPITDFPALDIMGQRRGPTPAYARPDWAEEPIWDLTTGLVTKHHVRGGGSPRSGHGPTPYTSANSPMRAE
jgi:hypothetical protein